MFIIKDLPWKVADTRQSAVAQVFYGTYIVTISQFVDPGNIVAYMPVPPYDPIRFGPYHDIDEAMEACFKHHEKFMTQCLLEVENPNELWNRLMPAYRKYKGYAPMTAEEADAAYDAAPAIPLSDEEIHSMIQRITQASNND